MFVKVKLSPSNKLTITKYLLADGYAKKTEKKTLTQVQDDRFNEAVEKVVSLQRIYDNYSSVDKPKISLAKKELDTNDVNTEVLLYDNVLKEFEKTNLYQIHRDFLAQQSLLDLLRKSQYISNKKEWIKEHKPRTFTKRASDKILEAGGVLDKISSNNYSNMLTLTLPGSGYRAYKALADSSSYIMNRLLQVIRNAQKYLPENHPAIHFFYVWEFQKRGALHLHFCISWLVDRKRREQLCLKLKDKWFELLKEVGEKLDVDLFAKHGMGTWVNNPEIWQWDCQPIKKSVAAYFAKYCSKNKEIATEQNKAKLFYPARFWGSSYSIKQWIKNLTFEVKITTYSEQETSDVIDGILDLVFADSEPVKQWSNEFEVLVADSDVIVTSGIILGFAINPDTYYSAFESLADSFPFNWFHRPNIWELISELPSIVEV